MKSDADKLANQCAGVSRLLKAIAHEQRLKMLCGLAQGEQTVAQLEAYCGASQSSVSQYLSKMRSEGLLTSRREGQQVFYRIENKALSKLMVAMQKIFCK